VAQRNAVAVNASATPECRFCAAPLRRTVVDLGLSPLCESYVQATELDDMEAFYPLNVRICERCFLMQLRAYVPPDEIFTEYAYFSSYSSSWVQHARAYADSIAGRLSLGPRSLVVEIGSNDGYLLQRFVERGVPVLGVEPAQNVAAAAVERGVRTIAEFFGTEAAERLVTEGSSADLIIANNVLAQVPDLNDFVAGMKRLLAPGGALTIEVPHLIRLIEGNQFDTIYHEHYSYFSFRTLRRILTAHGLDVFDVDELPTHGGSLRVYARHAEVGGFHSPRIEELSAREEIAGYETMGPYDAFDERVRECKRRLLEILIAVKRDQKSIAAYGAPGKGNTLLNYCGIRTDFLDYAADKNPYKQGRYLPGTHVPIVSPDAISASQPEFILILPWNIKEEIMAELAYTATWSARFIIPIPDVIVVAQEAVSGEIAYAEEKF
jgi:SAM-dependent methyltransferase